MKRFDECLIFAVVCMLGLWIIQSGTENVKKPDFLDTLPKAEQKQEKPHPQAKLARFIDNGIVCREITTLRNVAGAIQQNDVRSLRRMEQEGKIFLVKKGTIAEIQPTSKPNNSGIEMVNIVDGAYIGEYGYTITSALEFLN